MQRNLNLITSTGFENYLVQYNSGMNQHNQNKTNHPERRAKFERRMDFYVPVDVILVELDPSNYTMEITAGNHVFDEIGLNSDNNSLQPYSSATWHELSSGSSKK